MKIGEKIKVNISFDDPKINGETPWAIRVNETTAKLDNIPWFTDEYSLGDLVEIDEKNEVVRLIEKVANTRHVLYDPMSEDKAHQRTEWNLIRKHLDRYDIHSESATPGFFSIAVPLDVTEEKLNQVIAECPVKLKLTA
jgi:hypothetical protein